MAPKIRPNLGHTGTWPDGKACVDAECLLWIGDPLHTLNKLGYFDPTRYDMKKSEVAAQYRTILDRGVPSHLIVRVNGMLPKGHPIYDYLKRQYPKGSKNEYDGSLQPAIEIIEGNTRQWLALQAIAARAESGAPIDVIRRVPLDVRKNVSDTMAADIFQDANDHRQANGWMQQLKIYRARCAEGLTADQIASRMSQPPRVIAEFAVFDALEDEIARRYAVGKVTLARAKELVEVPRSEQVAKLDAQPNATRQKRTDGPISAVKIRKAGESFIETAKAHGITGLDPKGIGAVLRYIGGDRTALDGMRQVKALIVEAIGEKAPDPDSQNEQN